MRSRKFRNYDDYSLDACMMKVLELEDEYLVGELFTDDIGEIMGIEEEKSGKEGDKEVCILKGGRFTQTKEGISIQY